MKRTKTHLFLPACTLAACVTSEAATLTKADNTTSLGTASSWVENVVPATTDILLWNSTVTGAQSVATTGVFFGGLQITNPGGNITVTGGVTWSFNNNAMIDMSAATADLTISTNFTRVASANYTPTLTVASGRTLTFNGQVNNQGNTKTMQLAGAGTIVFNNSTGSGGAMSFNVNGPTVRMNAATNSWTAGTVAAGSLVLGHGTALQSQTLTVNATNGLGFATGITSATLGNLAGTGGFTLTNADNSAVALTLGGNNGSQSYTGALSGAGSLVKNGTGTLTLGGNNTFTGGIMLSNGSIVFNHSNAAAGGTITAANGTTMGIGSATSTHVTGNLALTGAAANVTVNSANISNSLGGTITGSSDQILTIAGTNQVNLSSSSQQLSNMLGTVVINSGSTLRFSASSLNNGGAGASFQVDGSITTRNNGSLTLGEVSGNGNISMGNSGPDGGRLNLTLGAKNTSSTYGGIISDGASATNELVNLTKAGSGTLTLTNTHSYTGTTTVSAGSLRVNGSIAASALTTVNAAATLAGSGTVGATTIAGTHSPGNSPGVQTFSGNLTYQDGSNLVWELIANTTTGRGTSFDGINLTGSANLAFTGATTLNLDFALAGSSVDWSDTLWDQSLTGTNGWKVFDLSSGSISGLTNLTIGSGTWNDGNGSALASIRPNASFSLFQDGNDLYLNYSNVSAIPEPGGLLGLGMLLGTPTLMRRRRLA